MVVLSGEECHVEQQSPTDFRLEPLPNTKNSFSNWEQRRDLVLDHTQHAVSKDPVSLYRSMPIANNVDTNTTSQFYTNNLVSKGTKEDLQCCYVQRTIIESVTGDPWDRVQNANTIPIDSLLSTHSS